MFNCIKIITLNLVTAHVPGEKCMDELPNSFVVFYEFVNFILEYKFGFGTLIQ